MNSIITPNDRVVAPLRPPMAAVPAETEAMRELGVGVLGPFICAYVDWVVARARRRGLDQLHFLSRDGQILHKVAAIRHPDALTAHYFYISRFAARMATLRPTPRPPTWLLYQLDRSVSGLCYQLGTEPKNHAEYLAGLGFSAGEWTAILPWPRYHKLTLAFINPANTALWRIAAERRQLLIDYLLQEGVGSGRPTAFVDTGWVASTQLLLSAMLKNAGHEADIHGYYLGLVASVPKAESWIFNLRNPDHWLAGYPGLLELFLSGDHAMVVGYEREGLRVSPRFKDQAAPAGISALHAAVCDYASACKPVDLVRMHEGLRRLIWRPTEREARAFKPVVFTSGQIRRTEDSMVPRLSFFQTLKVVFTRKRVVMEVPWPQATVVLSFPPGWRRWLLLALLRGKELRDQIRSVQSNGPWGQRQGPAEAALRSRKPEELFPVV